MPRPTLTPASGDPPPRVRDYPPRRYRDVGQYPERLPVDWAAQQQARDSWARYFNISPESTNTKNIDFGRLPPGSNWFAHDGPLVKASKWLSQVTRHTRPESGLTYDEAGWFKVEQIFNRRNKDFLRHFPNPRTFEFVILDNPGARFELYWSDTDGYMVRALMGHSMQGLDPSQILKEIRLANAEGFNYEVPRERTSQGGGPIYVTSEMCVHGTSLEAARSIIREGLLPGGPQEVRRAVHFATTLPKAGDSVVPGLRKKSEVLIFLDLERWLMNGKKAFATERFVICIFEKIPEHYIMAAIRVSDGLNLQTNTRGAWRASSLLLGAVPGNNRGSATTDGWTMECDHRP